MAKYKNIVVSGDIGTGTTTLTKALAEKLGWRYIVAGEFFRDYARDHSIPLWDKSKVPDEIDKLFDRELLEKIKNEKNYIFDTHYGGWFSRDLENVFRVLLICDNHVALKRILDRKSDTPETAEDIKNRRLEDRKKFRELYGNDDYENPKYFNIVIDTGINSAEEVVAGVLRNFQKT